MEEKLLATLRSGNDIPSPLVPIVYEFAAFVVLKDLPVGSEFGIDYMSWKTGDRFLGIKMIPPGFHFVFVSVKGAPRIGFVHSFTSREVLIYKWDCKEETLVRDRNSKEMDESAAEATRMGMKNIDSNLAPYPYEHYRKFYSLTDFVRKEDAERVAPLCGLITSQQELESLETKMEREADVGCSSSVNKQNPRRMRFADSEGLPVMEVKPGQELRFTPVPQLPGDLGRDYLDYSNHLEGLIRQIGEHVVLAEMQLAFVIFLIGQVWEGLEQWKKWVHVVCFSPSSLRTRPSFFLSLLRVLFFAVRECPRDFFVDIVSKDNFLTTTLSILFANIQEGDNISEELRKKSRAFKAFLVKNYSWDFEIE